MAINWKTPGRLEKLQALLDEGKTPGACCKYFYQEYGWIAHASTIRLAIKRYGLRYTPRATGQRVYVAKAPPVPVPVAVQLVGEPTCPLLGKVDYAAHDEDPGDDKGIYRGVSMALMMPRGGDD